MRGARGSAVLGFTCFAVVSYTSPDTAPATADDLGQILAIFTATSGQALGIISDPAPEIVVNGGHVSWPSVIAFGASDPSSGSGTT